MSIKSTISIALLSAIFASQTAFAQTTITFRYNDPDPEVIEAAIAAFEAENPDISVELERLSWADARTQYLRESAVGEGPDLAHLAFVWVLEIGSAGGLLPLNGLIEEHGIVGDVGFDDFVATELAEGRNGDIYALPWTADTITLVYNPEIFAEADVELPETWDDLATASREIFARTGKVGFGFPAGGGSGNQIWFLTNFHLWSNGHALVVEEDGEYKPGVDVETLADTFQYFVDFIGEGGNPRSNLAISASSDLSFLQPAANGEQAAIVLSPAGLSQLQDAYREQTGQDDVPYVSSTIPLGSVGGISHAGGRMLGINSNTDHPEETYRFVQFLTSTPFFDEYLTTQFPARRSALAEAEFAPGFEGFAEQLANARSWGAYANDYTPIGLLQDSVGREFSAILSGEKTADQAAQSLLDEINALLPG